MRRGNTELAFAFVRESHVNSSSSRNTRHALERCALLVTGLRAEIAGVKREELFFFFFAQGVECERHFASAYALIFKGLAMRELFSPNSDGVAYVVRNLGSQDEYIECAQYV